jgi:hypothetical protein
MQFLAFLVFETSPANIILYISSTIRPTDENCGYVMSEKRPFFKNWARLLAHPLLPDGPAQIKVRITPNKTNNLKNIVIVNLIEKYRYSPVDKVLNR